MNPSWFFLFFHLWFKAFRGAISVSLNVVPSTPRQNKQTKKKNPQKTIGWDQCQRFEITLLLPSQRKETRCRNAIWSKFVSSSSQTREISNTQAAEFNFVCLKGHWQCDVFCTSAGQESDPESCGTSCSALRNGGAGGADCNLASSRNTNNNPSMFLIRLLFILTSAVSTARD